MQKIIDRYKQLTANQGVALWLALWWVVNLVVAGASELHIFFKLVLPAMKPVLATLIVLSFVASWNDFFTPLIYTTDESMRTLPLALQTIAGGAGAAAIGNAGATAAATMLMTIPTVVLFAIAQKNVMETMTYSGIKG